MTDLEEIIEQKKRNNRGLYEAFSRELEKNKRTISEEVLTISNEADVKKLITKLINMYGDFEFLNSLQKEYEELNKTN